ncbi:hypothetical protein [Corynebacterium sp.]|uniref:hypothetical protein n=1 Tax=Corynebacterium sp. TaxID=1720 RepID=UPI0026DEFCE9|nr:hypothetical protein [Corynebacterium sp.]MDO5513073.1 hypothetical protein [Corynebacterium sp.]
MGFYNHAEDLLLLHESAHEDSCASLYVHAGIAAADAICAKSLGVHAKGPDHRQAVRLLAEVNKSAANKLELLLSLKTRAEYGHESISSTQLIQARRAAAHLIGLI